MSAPLNPRLIQTFDPKILALVLCFFWAGPTAAQVMDGRIHLTDPAKPAELIGKFFFHRRDVPALARPEFDDSRGELIQVPGQWQVLGLDQRTPAWYRVRFTFSRAFRGRDLAVMTPHVNSAHELYVNGVLLGGRGRVDAHGEGIRYSTQVQTYTIPAKLLREQNVLALRVRPYTSVGGISLPDFYLGEREAIKEKYVAYLLWNSGLAAAGFLACLYYLILFAFSPRERAYLYFSLLAFASFLYVVSTKTFDYRLVDNFLFHETLIHLGMSASPVLAFLFFRHYFNLKRTRFDYVILFFTPLLFGVFLIGVMVPAVYEFHLKYLFPALFLGGTAILVYLLVQGIRGIRGGRYGARTIVIGLSLFLLTIVNDVLSQMAVLPTERLYEEGFTIFTLSMAAALGIRLGRTLDDSDRFNRELDAKVEERTKALEKTRDKAEAVRMEIIKLSEFTRKINETTDLRSILDEIIGYVEKNFNIDGTMLHLVDTNTNELYYYHVNYQSYHTADDLARVSAQRIPLGEDGGIVALLVQRNRLMYFPSLAAIDGRDDPMGRLKNDMGIDSALIVPLVVRERPVGVLYFSNFGRKLELTRSQIAGIARFCQQIAGAVYGSALFQQVREQREKSERLLLNILPRAVAEELKEHGEVKPLLFRSVSVMFTDFVGFTGIAERIPPDELVHELDACFTQFDEVASRFRLEKLKTIGDAYMCAGGIPTMNQSHAVDACLAALEFQDFMAQMKSIKRNAGLPFWELRLGINTGPVTAGVVGKHKFAYDIWGDTVNTASRMESSGEPGRVNISENTYKIVRDFFDCEARGEVEAKGKGRVSMYFVKGIKPELSVALDGRRPNAEFHNRYLKLKDPS